MHELLLRSAKPGDLALHNSLNLFDADTAVSYAVEKMGAARLHTYDGLGWPNIRGNRIHVLFSHSG